MDKKTLKKGTRIYYTGDMANEEGFGVITHQSHGMYGSFVTLKMDDGRVFESLSVAQFSDVYEGHCGTRFVTEEAYKLFKRAQIAKIESRLNPDKIITDERIDELLVDASKEASHRGESELMDSLRALKLGFEYQAKLAVEKQLRERKVGFSGEFCHGKAWAYEKAAEDLGKIIKENS